MLKQVNFLFKIENDNCIMRIKREQKACRETAVEVGERRTTRIDNLFFRQVEEEVVNESNDLFLTCNRTDKVNHEGASRRQMILNKISADGG